MDRREFLAQSAKYGAAAGAAFLADKFAPLTLHAAGATPDLVAVKGGGPEAMFRAGIAALGGIGRFVKAGQTVVVKPNIGWDAKPELAANTHPGLVAEIVRACLGAGARKVYVFDNTCDYRQSCYVNSGIEYAARNAGATIALGTSEKYYQSVRIPGGVSLKETKVHELVLEADVFINVPIVKHHGGAQLTVAMKNLMGIVWDRRYWHRNDLHTCIADMCLWRKPTLNVVDAYRVLMKNGPRGGSPAYVALKGMQILSTDMVAADAAAAKVYGAEPASIPYIAKAAAKGIGRLDLASLNIKRISL